MPDTTRDPLRALLPHASEEEFLAAQECLDQYVKLSIDVLSAGPPSASNPVLTESNAGGTVIAGQVDPTRTLTNTG